MSESELESLLVNTNFSEKEKNRWRRLFLESEPEELSEMRESLLAQQYDEREEDY